MQLHKQLSVEFLISLVCTQLHTFQNSRYFIDTIFSVKLQRLFLISLSNRNFHQKNCQIVKARFLTIFLNARLRLQLIHPIGSKMPIKSGIRYKWIPQSGKDPMLSRVARRSQIRVFIFWVTVFGFADSNPNGKSRHLQETQPKFIIL